MSGLCDRHTSFAGDFGNAPVGGGAGDRWVDATGKAIASFVTIQPADSSEAVAQRRGGLPGYDKIFAFPTAARTLSARIPSAHRPRSKFSGHVLLPFGS